MTRQQRRAKDAAEQVESAEGRLTENELTQYKSLAHSLPMWLRTNGLLQTVAFVEAKAAAKKSKPHQELVDALIQHLRASGFAHRQGLLSTALVGLEYPDYLRWQEEAVACAGWLKRFSAARLGEPDRDAAIEPEDATS